MRRTRTLAVALLVVVVGLFVVDRSSPPAPAPEGEPTPAPARRPAPAPARRPAELEVQPAPVVQAVPSPAVPRPSDDSGEAIAVEDVARALLTEQQARRWTTEGEEAYAAGDLVAAAAAFRRVVEETPDASTAPFALYKLAWCEWSAGRRDEAIRDMEMAIAWMQKGEVAGAEVLVPDAQRALAEFRAEAGTPR